MSRVDEKKIRSPQCTVEELNVILNFLSDVLGS